MNILLGEVLGWCTDNVNWPDAISLEHFQWIMSLITTAASKPAQEAIWTEQDAYLQTEAGKAYLADIYKRRINLRKKMEPQIHADFRSRTRIRHVRQSAFSRADG